MTHLIKLAAATALLACTLQHSAQAAAAYGSIDHLSISVSSLTADPAYTPAYSLSGGHSYVAAGVTGKQVVSSDAGPITAEGWFTPIHETSSSENGFAVSEIESNRMRGYGQVNGLDQFANGNTEAPYFDQVATITVAAHTLLSITADLYASAAIANLCAPAGVQTTNACEYGEAFASLSLYSTDMQVFSGQRAWVLLNATGTGAPVLTDKQELIGAQVSFANDSDQAQSLYFYAGTQYSLYSLAARGPVFTPSVPEPSAAMLMGLGLLGLGSALRRRAGSRFAKSPQV